MNTANVKHSDPQYLSLWIYMSLNDNVVTSLSLSMLYCSPRLELRYDSDTTHSQSELNQL